MKKFKKWMCLHPKTQLVTFICILPLLFGCWIVSDVIPVIHDEWKNDFYPEMKRCLRDILDRMEK